MRELPSPETQLYKCVKHVTAKSFNRSVKLDCMQSIPTPLSAHKLHYKISPSLLQNIMPFG